MNDSVETFEEILRAAGPKLAPLCQALKDLIIAVDGDASETVWLKQKIASFGVGPKKMSEHYAYLGIQGSYVNLGFYHGAVLKDPEKLLEGTGKRLRHVKIRTLDEAARAAVLALIRESIQDREMHASPPPEFQRRRSP